MMATTHFLDLKKSRESAIISLLEIGLSCWSRRRLLWNNKKKLIVKWVGRFYLNSSNEITTWTLCERDFDWKSSCKKGSVEKWTKRECSDTHTTQATLAFPLFPLTLSSKDFGVELVEKSHAPPHILIHTDRETLKTRNSVHTFAMDRSKSRLLLLQDHAIITSVMEDIRCAWILIHYDIRIFESKLSPTLYTASDSTTHSLFVHPKSPCDSI